MSLHNMGPWSWSPLKLWDVCTTLCSKQRREKAQKEKEAKQIAHEAREARKEADRMFSEKQELKAQQIKEDKRQLQDFNVGQMVRLETIFTTLWKSFFLNFFWGGAVMMFIFHPFTADWERCPAPAAEERRTWVRGEEGRAGGWGGPPVQTILPAGHQDSDGSTA